MSETTAPGPRHARSDGSAPAEAPHDEVEPPTTAIPTVIPGEFTDDATQVLPVVPAQRGAAFVPAPRYSPELVPPADGQPAGLHPAAPARPARRRRRRVLPAVLAGVTACLLAAGRVVGIGGARGAEMTDQPPVSGTP